MVSTSNRRYCIRLPIQKDQPPVAIGSSSDGVTGGGKIAFISPGGSVFHQHCRPPAAIGSSSDSVTSGGKNFHSCIHSTERREFDCCAYCRSPLPRTGSGAGSASRQICDG